MKCDYSCNSAEHHIGRRQFLGGLAGGFGAVVGGMGVMANPAVAKQLAKDQKRVIVIYMSGGLSQLESWDPKPKTNTGGPFRAIPTAVPGMHISELLPMTARHMDKLALVRSINTKNGDHGKGRYQMTYGRNQRPGVNLPHLGAVCARALESADNPLPGHIRIPGGGRGNDAAYLGPKYSSIGINGKPPENSARHDSISEAADRLRNSFRRKVNSDFARQRRTAETDVFTYSYEQAQELMKQRDVFDVSKEPAKAHDRYGKFDFGKHCQSARLFASWGFLAPLERESQRIDQSPIQNPIAHSKPCRLRLAVKRLLINPPQLTRAAGVVGEEQVGALATPAVVGAAAIGPGDQQQIVLGPVAAGQHRQVGIKHGRSPLVDRVVSPAVEANHHAAVVLKL